METKYVRVPFELELAKEISNGSKDGRIVTREGKSVRVVCWDKKDKDFPIVCLVNDDSEEYIKTYTMQGVWNIDTNCTIRKNDLFLEIPEYATFKDGDVIAFGDEYTFIGIFKSSWTYNESHSDYVVLSHENRLMFDGDAWTYKNARFATEAEKQKLNDALKASKDPRAKECLKKLGIDAKQECEFKPFDRVLVRQSESDKWEAMLFSNYTDKPHRYRCLGMNYMYCIKYEGNEHLLGTDKSE